LAAALAADLAASPRWVSCSTLDGVFMVFPWGWWRMEMQPGF
jgi:hypothetical protein